ncbi:MAG TPA: YihY/virulence factor BrkB family protein [Microbacterium sp.]|uniref:YihY/virulence factor BrkB family protein n=1 Tax=Microbacterium sp. TaxID=51671 RepID=UPI002B496336|nr:YihY/virulence factor BrkB family protein [Microbacterium sp.]HKT58098.1 YihY/virulence factor BrkB family protein [Microbacterium sp.]
MSAASRQAKAASHHRAIAAVAKTEEQRLRIEFEQREEELRERFAVPLARATEIRRRTLALFPVRVWRGFTGPNGFLLAAGISYQALFAFFAAIYVVFAIVGVWLGADADAVDWLINLINQYLPGVIGTGPDALVNPADIDKIVASSAGALTVAGIVAIGALVWTAIGWITYLRRAVREILGLPQDTRAYLLLKARDLVAALVFGIAMVAGGIVNNLGTWALQTVWELLGLNRTSFWFDGILSVLSVVISFVLNTAALAALFRLLAGVALKWRRIWPGSMLGGAAITVLQLSIGLLASHSPSNTLLLTFVVFIAMLLWFRLISIVVLVAAAWIATAAEDKDIPLQAITEQQRLQAQHEALLAAARERLRTAQEVQKVTPWYRRLAANRAVRAAEDELLRVEAAAPGAVIVAPRR